MAYHRLKSRLFIEKVVSVVSIFLVKLDWILQTGYKDAQSGSSGGPDPELYSRAFLFRKRLIGLQEGIAKLI